jgi:hypothetical protein
MTKTEQKIALILERIHNYMDDRGLRGDSIGSAKEHIGEAWSDLTGKKCDTCSSEYMCDNHAYYPGSYCGSAKNMELTPRTPLRRFK